MACISKEVELLGKNSGLEEATVFSGPVACGVWKKKEPLLRGAAKDLRGKARCQ